MRFTTLDGQSVTVTSGMKLHISRSGVLTAPIPAAAQEVQVAQDLTDISGAASQGAVAAAVSRPLVPLVVTVTGVAAAVGIGVWQGTRPVVSTVIP